MLARDQVNPYKDLTTRYQMLRTDQIVEAFVGEGWQFRDYQETRTRKPERVGYQNHVLRMRHEKQQGKNVGDYLIETVIRNSHDGTSSFQITLGLFVLKCSNGLATPVKSMFSAKFVHRGITMFEVQQAVDQLAGLSGELDGLVFKMKQRNMLAAARMEFAKSAFRIRNQDERFEPDLYKILKANRPESIGDSLWDTFNNVQENLMSGGFGIQKFIPTDAGTIVKKERKARPIKSALKDLRINQELWSLAQTYLA